MKKTDPVKFILATDKNFAIAAAVASAWVGARQQIVSDFLKHLDARLLKSFKGWKSELEHEFYVDPWASYDVWKPSWDNKFGIGLMCHDYGRAITFGVYRDDVRLGKKPISKEILQAVSKIDQSAKADQWWEARVRFRNPTDWTTPEVLWQMKGEGVFFDDVIEKLVKVIQASTPIINKMVVKMK